MVVFPVARVEAQLASPTITAISMLAEHTAATATRHTRCTSSPTPHPVDTTLILPDPRAFWPAPDGNAAFVPPDRRWPRRDTRWADRSRGCRSVRLGPPRPWEAESRADSLRCRPEQRKRVGEAASRRTKTRAPTAIELIHHPGLRPRAKTSTQRRRVASGADPDSPAPRSPARRRTARTSPTIPPAAPTR